MKCPHCDTEVTEHPASRCLDSWIAVALAELEVTYYPGVSNPHYYPDDDWNNDYPDKRHTLPIPHYSTRIEDAWRVVEKMHNSNNTTRIVVSNGDGDSFDCDIYGAYLGWNSAHVSAETWPLAICRAALLAVHNA